MSALEAQDRRTAGLFLRLLRYLDGVWKKSGNTIQFFDWNAGQFSRSSGKDGRKFVSLDTLERQFPRFQKWCDEYFFTRVNVGGRWRVRVTRNPYVIAGLPGKAVSARLVAAIVAYVSKSGRVSIDREFCRKFSEISSLPLQQVETVWLKLKKIPGLKHKWRGVGRGRKMCVERPERWAEICAERAAQKTKNSESQTRKLSSDSAFLRNEKIENGGPAARGPEETARAVPASETAGGGNGRAGEGDAEPGRFETPEFYRAFCGRKPIQICGRWVQTTRLIRLACWLASGHLKNCHAEFPRVAASFPHARKFAHQALAFGYGVPAIVAAWRAGVARSHADAADAGDPRDTPRVPSAAKAYAVAAIRAADGRSSAELWQAFFQAPPRQREARSPAKPPAKQEPRTEPAPRVSAAESAAVLAALRAKIAAQETAATVESAPVVTLGELAEFLALRGETMAQFAALPYPRRVFALGQCAKWRAARKC